MDQAANSSLPVPIELVVAILSKLGFRDIARCRAVSRELDELILTTSALQYRIKLGIAGYVDGSPRHPTSTASRLQDLCRERHSWLHPAPIAQYRPLRITSQASEWTSWTACREVIVGCRPIVVAETGLVTGTMLDIFRLNGNANMGPEPGNLLTTIHVMKPLTSFQDLFVDASQDLFILQSREEARVVLSFWSLQSGQAHPRAISKEFYVLPDQLRDEPLWRPRLRIWGDVISVRTDPPWQKGSMILYNWVNGKRLICRAPHDELYVDACLTHDNYLLLIKLRKSSPPSVSIDLFAVDGPWVQGQAPNLLATFELPPFHRSVATYGIQCYFPSGPGAASIRSARGAHPVKFYPSVGLVCLYINIGLKSYILFTPIPMLLSLVRRYQRAAVHRTFPWAIWGESRTRILENVDRSHESLTEPSMHGFCAVLKDRILDFNPYDLSGQEFFVPRSREHVDRQSRIIRHPTVIPEGIFRRPVTTSLHYCETRFFRSPKPHVYQWVFQDEDGPKLVRLVKVISQSSGLKCFGFCTLSLR